MVTNIREAKEKVFSLLKKENIQKLHTIVLIVTILMIYIFITQSLTSNLLKALLIFIEIILLAGESIIIYTEI